MNCLWCCPVVNIPKNGDSGGRGDSTIRVHFHGGQWDPGVCCRECGEQGKGDSLPLCSALGRPHLEHWAPGPGRLETAGRGLCRVQSCQRGGRVLWRDPNPPGHFPVQPAVGKVLWEGFWALQEAGCGLEFTPCCMKPLLGERSSTATLGCTSSTVKRSYFCGSSSITVTFPLRLR